MHRVARAFESCSAAVFDVQSGVLHSNLSIPLSNLARLLHSDRRFINNKNSSES